MSSFEILHPFFKILVNIEVLTVLPTFLRKASDRTFWYQGYMSMYESLDELATIGDTSPESTVIFWLRGSLWICMKRRI